MALYYCRWLALLAAALAVYPRTATAAAPNARYFVVFLRPDPARKTLDKVEGERVQDAHMANIRNMARDGILVAAGPFEDTPRTISGIFVFTIDSLESAKRIAAQDPTVVEHRNTVDVYPWQGPAGIGVEYTRLHKMDPQTPENMQVHPLYLIFRGPAWEQKAGERESILEAHARFTGELRQQGKLSAAGSIEAPGDLLDMVVFKPLPEGDAQRLMEDDPAVKAGVLRVEPHHWWCSEHVLPW